MGTTLWSASGLLVENCNCQLLCPAHVSFKNRYTNDLCHGYWAVHIDEGHYGAIELQDLNIWSCSNRRFACVRVTGPKSSTSTS